LTGKTYDIIPDIHGQYEKLTHALSGLGYREHHGAWRHPDPLRSCLFLGDFIDRGPRNGDVIRLVRTMLDAGTAQAVMGNHELNAIHFHSQDPETGTPLRPWSAKNLRQHHSFLQEFTPGSPATQEAISWMQGLPLFLELDGFRAVHACWDEARIDKLGQHTATGVLSEAQLMQVADPKHVLNDLVETITKGPDVPLPNGHRFADKDGHIRTEVRVKWWNASGKSWADIAMSVPTPNALPTGALPKNVTAMAYPAGAKPVFFGHYWLTGTPVLQAPNALCLDYSAGKDGPLISYQMHPESQITLKNMSYPNVNPPQTEALI